MLIVTIAALVMAAGLGWFAYRLMQEEQRRSDARVALLTAALQDTPGDLESFARSGPVGFAPMTLPPVPAAAPSRRGATDAPELVYLDDDSRDVLRFRSERTADDTVPLGQAHDLAEPVLAPPAPVTSRTGEVQTRAAGLFADVPDARPADARGLIALAGLLLVAALAVGYLWFGRAATADSAAATTQSATTPATPTQGGVPLELVSLTHERRGNSLVVRGEVRNPVSGSDRTGLAASVMLLDQAGSFLGSGRASVATTRLVPGGSAGFVVELPSHKDVRRYRVTFRGVDGGLVPHADKRK